jgi:hypothetical protein
MQNDPYLLCVRYYFLFELLCTGDDVMLFALMANTIGFF